MHKKLLIVAGARPNFMKIAPLIRVLRGKDEHGLKSSSIEHLLVHTGQHYDAQMSDVFFSELGIPAPDINLEIGSGSHAEQTAAVMIRFDSVCAAERPDWVVVVGDVNSTMACTLVCAKRGIKVAHIEAGLRSFDRSMPEEVNRLVTDALADLLLTPSPDADGNLLREGVAADKIKLVGNIMIDTVLAHRDKAREEGTLAEFGLRPGQFAYVTLHRPSNVDARESLAAIMEQLMRLSRRLPIIFPVHPRTRKMLSDFGINKNGARDLKIVDPIGYHSSLSLVEEARFVLTDSGGLQEESTFFRTPCLTLRPNTERPITITLGSNKLTSVSQLPGDIDAILAGPDRIGSVPPLWDGQTARRCVENIAGLN